jgi:hypothetical protein
VRAVAFEIEHRVDEMLEDARSGERPFLGDVPDQETRGLRRLAASHEQRRRLADLADAAGRRRERRRVERLDRVDHHGARPHALDLLDDELGRGLGQDEDARVGEPETLGTKPYLLGRLLAGDVEHRQSCPESAPHACSASVDFPMPGSPPRSTIDPCTRPPPRTRSSSPTPVERRIALDAVTVARDCGAPERGAAAPGRAPARTSSTSVPHPSHPGHCPSQRGVA